MITSISPSSINAFDSRTTFGCERRWWYKYVAKKPEPVMPHLERGVKLHALIEKYLKGEPIEGGEGEEYGLFLAGQHMIDLVKPKVKQVEAPVSGLIADVPISSMSKCDVVLTDGILDWKTSSDIKRYGKTPETLKVDTQLVIYARVFFPGWFEVRMAHGYFQTGKGKSTRTELVETTILKSELDDYYENVIVPTVERMKRTSEVVDPKFVPPNLKACRMCPHASYCTQDKEENPVMSFFKKLHGAQQTPAAPPPAPQPEPVRVVEGPLEKPAVLPPDAPKSDPAIAAEPVEGFSPVPPPKVAVTEFKKELGTEVKVVEVERNAEGAVTDIGPNQVKRGPGRPKGAKNRPKMTFVDVPNDPPQATVEAPAPVSTPKPNPKGFTITSVTVHKAYKIGLPNYSSVDFGYSLTAEGEDYEATVSALEVEVEKRLEAEAAKWKDLADENAKGRK